MLFSSLSVTVQSQPLSHVSLAQASDGISTGVQFEVQVLSQNILANELEQTPGDS